MAITVPTALPQSGDATDQMRRNAAIQSDHIEAVVNADAYVRARLRPLLSTGAESYTTTSTSYVTWIEERPVTPSHNDSDSLDVLVYGQNVDCKATVTDGSATTATATVSVGATLGTSSGTIDVSGLSGTSWRVKVEARVPSSGTATIQGLNVKETTHTALTIG